MFSAEQVGGGLPCVGTLHAEQGPPLLQRLGYVGKGEAGGRPENVAYFRRVISQHVPPGYYNLAFHWLLDGTEDPMSQAIRVGLQAWQLCRITAALSLSAASGCARCGSAEGWSCTQELRAVHAG